MTRKTSSAKARSPLVTPRYMFGTAKRGWPCLVLFLILFILFYTLIPVLSLPRLRLSILNDAGYQSTLWTHEDILNSLTDIASAMMTTYVVLSAASAIFAGVYFMQFMQNRTSAGFYHSLPERRSGHFISVIFSSFAVYFIASVVNLLLSLLIFACHGFLYFELLPIFFSGLGYGIFYFIVFLSVAMLAGVISGNRVIHTIMTGFILFALPVVYVSAMLLLRHGVQYLETTELMGSIKVLSLLSPFFRVIYVLSPLSSNGSVWPMIIFDAVMSAAFFALAYFAYSKRKIERSGNPIIFAPLGEIIKYVIIGPTAVLFSEFFDLFGSGMLGFAAGLILSYMLCNTVLNRSAKAMFSHWRGMLIYSASMIALSLVLSLGCFGIFDYAVPVAGKISIELYTNGVNSSQEIVISDRDDIEKVRDTMKDLTNAFRSGNGMLDHYSSFDFMNDPESYARYATLSITYTSPFGIEIPYTYNSVAYELTAPLIDIMLENQTNDVLPGSNNPYFFDINMDMKLAGAHFVDNLSQYFEENGEENAEQYRDRMTDARIVLSDSIKNTAKNEIMPHATKGYQNFTVGYASLNYRSSSATGGDYWNYVPITVSDLSAIGSYIDKNGLTQPVIDSTDLPMFFNYNECGFIFKLSEDEYFDSLAKTIERIVVYNRKTGEKTSYTGDEIRAILPSLAAVDRNDISTFTKTDPDYNILIEARGASLYTDYDYEKYEMSEAYPDVDVDMYPDTYETNEIKTYITWFLEGQAPDFVR